jgi:signal transduction histidine kinase
MPADPSRAAPHFLDRLSTKIALAAMVFLFALGSAIAFLVINGLRRTQMDAYTRSLDFLVKQAEAGLTRFVDSESQLLAAHLQAPEHASRQAAHYYATLSQVDLTTERPNTTFNQTQQGSWIMANPDRRADLWLPDGLQPHFMEGLHAAFLLGEYCAELLDIYPDLSSILFVSAGGYLVHAPRLDAPYDLGSFGSNSETQWILDEVSPAYNPRQRSFWSEINLGAEDASILFSTPVYLQGDFAGVLVVSLPTSHLADHLSEYHLTPKAQAVLLNQQGQVITFADPANPESAAPENLDLSSLPNLLDGDQIDERGVMQVTIAGELVLLAYAPLGEPPWSLVIITPMHEIAAQAEQVAGTIWSNSEEIISSTLLMLVIFFAVAIVITLILFDRLLNRRIRVIIAGVRSITSGDLVVNLPETPDDELGILSGAFNQMTNELLRRNQERAQAQLHLEQRIEESTSALKQLYEKSEKRSSELEILYQADEHLYRHLRLDQVLQALVDVTIEQLKADKASVQVWEPSSNRLVVRAARGFSPAMIARMSEYRPGDGIAGKVFVSGQVMAVDDSIHAPEPADLIARVEGIRSTLSVPITINKQIFGVFGMDYCQPRTFTMNDTRLFLALAQRAAIAIENARLYEQAEQAATLEERQRLARELHDAVTQSLYSLVLLSEAGRRHAVAGNLAQVEHHLGRLGETAQQALKEMRLLVYELRPLALQEIGLAGALQQRLDAVEKRAGIQARLQIEGHLDFYAPYEEAFYRIAQEALNNSLKHAQAAHVLVRMYQGTNHIRMEIEDDGHGFDNTSIGNGGIGLKSMQERAQRLGGELTIKSVPGSGTNIALQVQLPGERVDKEIQEETD